MIPTVDIGLSQLTALLLTVQYVFGVISCFCRNQTFIMSYLYRLEDISKKIIVLLKTVIFPHTEK